MLLRQLVEAGEAWRRFWVCTKVVDPSPPPRRSQGQKNWNEAEVREARWLRVQGLSWRQIAKRLGRSKNSVEHKMRRLRCRS